MQLDTLDLDLSDGIAHITLNRPDDANAMNAAMTQDLLRAANHCDGDARVRAVLLTARGSLFCAGGDLKAFAAAGDGLPALAREMTVYLHAAISRFTRMRAPLVVAVNGAAAGAGMSLAICGDLVVAADCATFTMAYTAAGLAPDGSSSFFLPRLVGLRRAQELMFTNRRLSAAEALDWGLVTRVVAPDALHTEALAMARRLADGPTRAHGEVKRLLAQSFSTELEAQMEQEARAIAAMAGSEDGRQGIDAFVHKRAARFIGS